MIPNCDHLWSLPQSLPLPAGPPSDPVVATCEDADKAAPTRPGEKQLPAKPPVVLPDEDYQWMTLL
jgi:hypothetical protein